MGKGKIVTRLTSLASIYQHTSASTTLTKKLFPVRNNMENQQNREELKKKNRGCINRFFLFFSFFFFFFFCYFFVSHNGIIYIILFFHWNLCKTADCRLSNTFIIIHNHYPNQQSFFYAKKANFRIVFE